MTVKIQVNKLPVNMLLAGIPGAGKSYGFEFDILPKIKEDSRPIIILDYKDQYKTGSTIRLSEITGPAMLGELMQGKYSNGRKPRILRIIAPNYDIDKIDSVIFGYLNDCKPKILVIEEAHFIFEDLIRKQIPAQMKKYFRTAIGEHNKGHNCVLITQFTRDIPSKILNCFQDGRLYYLPLKELHYLWDMRYLEEDPDYVQSIISPYQSYDFYDVGKHLRGEPQSEEVEKEEFRCACPECGVIEDSNEHCNQIKCPNCGTVMRRADRPGTGIDRSQSMEIRKDSGE